MSLYTVGTLFRKGSDADFKQYDVILQDKVRTGMQKVIGGYYTDALQASKDNKAFLTKYINNLRA